MDGILKIESDANEEISAETEKSNVKRVEAQKAVNDELAKEQLKAIQEREKQEKEREKEILNACTEINDAVIDALKERYDSEKELADDALKEEVERRKDASNEIIEQYEREHTPLTPAFYQIKYCAKDIVKVYFTRFRGFLRLFQFISYYVKFFSRYIARIDVL
ncbi:hypothetical protein FACS1894188_12320 [Clostridia bacterium]|nr:hypothetical protein FACS1894188_12320 [Clostridia bacterium]